MSLTHQADGAWCAIGPGALRTICCEAETAEDAIKGFSEMSESQLVEMELEL